jgi:hypothetical protein
VASPSVRQSNVAAGFAALATPVVVGNYIVVFANASGTSVAGPITDSLGNTYTLKSSSIDTPNGSAWAAYVAPVTVAGTASSIGTGTFSQIMFAYEITGTSGLEANTAIGQVANVITGAGSANTTVTAISASGSLLLTGCMDFGNLAVTVGSGATILNTNTAGASYLGVASKSVAAGSQTIAWSTPASDVLSLITLSFAGLTPYQIGSPVTGSSATGNLTLTKTLTAGSTLLLGISEYQNGTGTGIPTVSGGGTWSQVVSGNVVAFHNAVSIWRLDGVAAGSTTITITPNVVGDSLGGVLTEWTALAAVDKALGGGAFGAAPTIGPTAATSTAVEVVFAVWGDDSLTRAGATIPATGYTSAGNISTNTSLAADYLITSTTGTQTASWGTLTTADQWSVAIATFAAPPTATATTLTGPTTGAVGSPSSNFTVGANGAITGTVIITPSSGGAGGTFTPTTVSISSGSPTGTFTYTGPTNGVQVISTTNNGSLANPASISYFSVAAPSALTVNGGIAFDGIAAGAIAGSAAVSGGGGTTYNDTLTESVATAATISAIATFASAMSEAITALDTDASTLVFGNTLAESTTVTDAYTGTVVGGGTTYNDTLTESVAAADALAAAATFLNAVAESIAASDTVVSVVTLVNALAESVATSDSTTAAATFPNTVAESVATADTETVQFVANNALAESVATADSSTTTYTAGTTLTESVISGDSLTSTQVFNSTLSEAVTPADTDGSAQVFVLTLSESTTLLDSYTGTIAGGPATYNDTLAESLTMADALIASQVFVSLLSESIAASDTNTAAATFINTLAESIALADGSTANFIAVNTLAEAIAVADALGAGQVMITTIAEQVVMAATYTSSGGGGTIVWPDPSTVLLGVQYGPTGTEYTGTYVDAIRYELTTGRLVKPLGTKLSILL